MDYFMLVFNITAGSASIASCVLAFYVYFNFDKVKEKIEKQERKRRKQRAEIKTNLSSFQQVLLFDGIRDLKTRSSLRKCLMEIKNSFGYLLKSDLKKKINIVIKNLNGEDFDIEKTCAIMDDIITKIGGEEL